MFLYLRVLLFVCAGLVTTSLPAGLWHTEENDVWRFLHHPGVWVADINHVRDMLHVKKLFSSVTSDHS